MPLNVLVIGGTRLLGLALVRRLMAAGNNVTVLSRHPERCPKGAENIGAEREDGLLQLSGRKFDVTVDLIAYDETAPNQVFNCFDPGVYVLVSSTWIVRLAPFLAADHILNSVDAYRASLLPNVTYSYLLGKMHAEATVLEMRKKNNRSATILRLPIFWGQGEHTGRFNFYRQRIADGSPVICVDGGNNYAQIVCAEDVAGVAAAWLGRAAERPIWEAVPDKGTKVKDVIKIIAKGAGNQPPLIDVSSKQLSADLPDYLTEEPLWRETPVDVTESNLFITMGVTPTPLTKWLCDLAGQETTLSMSELRKKEITYLKNNFNDAKLRGNN